MISGATYSGVPQNVQVLRPKKYNKSNGLREYHLKIATLPSGMYLEKPKSTILA